MKRVTLTPAYGRDYKSAKAARLDFDADKDFIISDYFSKWDGKPANRADLLSAGYREVTLRFSKLMKVCVVPLGKPDDTPAIERPDSEVVDEIGGF